MNRSAARQHVEPVIRIMVIGDVSLVRKTLGAIFDEEVDLTVVAEAADGESALVMTRCCQPDVILVDMCMSKLNSMQATRNIRAEMPAIPVIALSLNEEPVVRLEMRKAGVTTFIARPNIPSMLCATIRALAHQSVSTAH